MLLRLQVLITATGAMRAKKVIALKDIADEACTICKSKGFEACCRSWR